MAVNDKIRSVKNFFTKAGKRNLIIVCAVVLIGAAVWLNWVFFSENDGDGYTYSGSTGMTGELDNSKNPTSGDEAETDAASTTDSYFATVQVSRQRARDEAIEVLQAVVDSKDSDDAAKSEALAEIATIADQIRLESNIESLILAKGFAQCVAVLNGDSASIVVEAKDLQAAQIAQINAIVYEQTGIEPSGVTIISKS